VESEPLNLLSLLSFLPAIEPPTPVGDDDRFLNHAKKNGNY